MLATGYPPQVGGIQTILSEISEHLPPGEVEVLAPRDDNASDFDATCAQVVHRREFAARSLRHQVLGRALGGLISPLLTQFPTWFSAARELVRNRPIELVQCGHVGVAGVGYALERLNGVPYVVYTYAQEIMDARVPKSKVPNRALGRAFLGHASAIFTLSEFTRGQVLAWGVREDRVVRIPLGPAPTIHPTDADVRREKERLGLRDRRIILTVGRLVKRKGQDMTIRALPGVIEKVPEAAYLIVGGGPMEQSLREETRRLGLGKSVVIAGDAPHDRIGIYYALADVFVMPSRALTDDGDVEGFGLVYLEANAHGKPCIGGRSGGVPDAVLDGETGLLVDPWDPEDIGQAIVRLLIDGDLAARLGESGRRRVEREMNWTQAAQTVRDTLCHVLAEQR
jgi:phosphatidylinositol alpha-1,6-mannosyltransferase